MFHSAQLGQEKDTIEQTRFGVIDLNRINMGPFNNLIPETLVPSLPFVFRSVDHMRKTMDGPVGDQILKAFEPHGLVALAFYDFGARSFYNSKRPINTPADLKGMKVRVIQSDLFLDMVNALRRQRDADASRRSLFGACRPASSTAPRTIGRATICSRHFEVAKNYSLTEHSMSPEVLVMSKKSFDKLSPEDQKAVREAAKEFVVKMRELWEAREKEAEKKIRASGSQINTVQKQPFIDAMKPVYEKYVKDEKLKDLVARIQATN